MMRVSILLVLLALTGCGADSSTGDQTGEVAVQDAWARPASGSGESAVNSAAYFHLHNFTDEAVTLIGAAADVAAATEIHETTMEEGVMRMRHREEVEVPPGESVFFEPGGLHVMLMDLVEDLVEGNSFTLTLHFADGGEREVQVEVQFHQP